MKIKKVVEEAKRTRVDVTDATPEEQEAVDINFAQHLIEKVQYVRQHGLAVALTPMESRFLEAVLFAYLESHVTP